MPRKSRKGGGWFTSDENGPGPFSAVTNLFKSKESPLAVAPEPVKTAITEGARMAQTAGKRLKKHIRVNPASTKDVSKLLKTKKGDRMLGKRRKTKRH